MKTPYLFFTLLFVSQLSYAQDWLPIADTSYIYTYLDCDKDQLYWLRADSISQDTVFVNKVIVDVDSMLPSDIGISCEPISRTTSDVVKVVRSGQANFLENKIIDQNNGVFQLLDPGNRVILGQAKVGDSWLFDSIANVYAGVVSAQNQQIWEQTDSVKTILLSTGDSILLSKSHGILKYPKAYYLGCYYELIGINGKGVGRQMPRLIDFYDFEIGDKFEFHSSQESVRSIELYHGIKQYEILGKGSIENGIITYVVAGYSMRRYYCKDDTTISNLSTVSYDTEYREGHPVSKAFKTLPTGNLDSIPFSINELKGCYETYNAYKLDAKGSISIKLGVNSPFIGRDSSDAQLAIMIQSGLGRSGYWADITSGNHFVEGLGRIETFTLDEYFGYKEKLVAYRKNGVTVGTFTPEPKLKPKDPPPGPNDDCVGLRIASIHPNPVRETLNITLNQSSEVYCELWDLQGSQLFTTQLFPTQDSIFLYDNKYICEVYLTSVTIPPSVSTGLYLLRVSSDEGIETKKIFISN